MSSPPGSIIGTVEQQWSILYPRFDVIIINVVIIIIIILIVRFVIKDESGSPILKIEGPLCPCSCCGDVDFSVRKSLHLPKRATNHSALLTTLPYPLKIEKSYSPGLEK